MPPFTRRTLLRGAVVGFAAAAATAANGIASAAPPGRPTPIDRLVTPTHVLTRLPGAGHNLALTIDDGTNTDAVAALIRFCRNTGARMTFFINGAYPSWRVNSRELLPLVESGQVQLGNHTWSHPELTSISSRAVADQITRNADFLRRVYGVDGRPYFRPPYGRRNATTDRIAAELGYSTVALWNATIGDDRPIDSKSLLAHANKSFQPQNIVLAHANQSAIIGCLPQLLKLTTERTLQTVTLADAFGG